MNAAAVVVELFTRQALAEAARAQGWVLPGLRRFSGKEDSVDADLVCIRDGWYPLLE